MSFLWWGVSRSVLTSVCPLLWLLSCPSPFTKMTSQSLLEASNDQVSCAFVSDGIGFSPSVTVPCSGSVSLSLLQASRFSLLLQSRCLLPSWGRRRRPCFRPVFLGLPPGLLFLLNGLPTLLMEHGVPETTMQKLENLTQCWIKRSANKEERQTSARGGRTGHSSSGDGGHRGVSSLQPLKLLY